MHRFMRSFQLDIGNTITGRASFPGKMMKSERAQSFSTIL
jgi:hypothetical protein